MNYWKAIALGVSCFLLTSWYTTSTVLSYDGQVLILNAATEPVRNGQLEVCDQKFQFGGIGQGKTKAIRYEVRSDSQYKLVVEFDSGRTLTKEIGEVTNGHDFQDILTVTDLDVSLTR
ncbi:MAG TPA: hypothetical protein VLA67_02755 [Nitrospiraceae bacterium]|nr:hypothetical protein [Nitrospiraceae bacterium]